MVSFWATVPHHLYIFPTPSRLTEYTLTYRKNPVTTQILPTRSLEFYQKYLIFRTTRNNTWGSDHFNTSSFFFLKFQRGPFPVGIESLEYFIETSPLHRYIDFFVLKLPPPDVTELDSLNNSPSNGRRWEENRTRVPGEDCFPRVFRDYLSGPLKRAFLCFNWKPRKSFFSETRETRLFTGSQRILFLRKSYSIKN